MVGMAQTPTSFEQSEEVNAQRAQAFQAAPKNDG
jgi:hypothetical protein